MTSIIIDVFRSAFFQLELRDIDEAEARWLHRLRDFDKLRERLVHRLLPLGTRIRWKQTENRDVFEAEGIVSRWETEKGECPEVLCAGYSRKEGGAWVTVKFTKHPGLERRLVVEGPLLAQILVLELERL